MIRCSNMKDQPIVMFTTGHRRQTGAVFEPLQANDLSEVIPSTDRPTNLQRH